MKFYSVRKNIYLIANIIDSQTGLCSDSASPNEPDQPDEPGRPYDPDRLDHIVSLVREEQVARPDGMVGEWG